MRPVSAVPKIAVNEDGDALLEENDIRAACDARNAHAVTKAQSMQSPPDEHLARRICFSRAF
jgi:hypothetical protein